MAEKETYIQRFKELYREKSGRELSDDLALEYFENLIVLTDTITSHISLKKIIIPQNYGKRK